MEQEDKMFKVRHSLAHILAMAVVKKFPDAKLGVGPVIENGFYYDFLLPEKLSDTDLLKLTKEMKKIIQQKVEFKKDVTTRSEALKQVKKQKQDFKTELIKDLPADEEISFYSSHNFSDLCRGPHVKDSSEIKADAFALTHLAGAYWRGDEKNDMLVRIYGVAFADKKELEEYLAMLEEAKKRDHRKLGKELDLFTFSELVGAGLPMWTPKGTVVREELDKFVWELRHKYDYQKVAVPHITKKDLYITSGHWEKFSDELFKIKTREGHEFAMKPMNCPHHTQIYAHLPRSYRDLPQRYAETTMVYRDEQSGELAGLSRVRCITQDDAHVFCRENQIKEEVVKIIDIVQTFYKVFNFDLQVRLSLHDPKNFEKYLGTPKVWQKTETDLRKVLKNEKINFEEAAGEAAMYGPKIDFIAKDSLGREWQVATIQLDRNMPERFDLTCANEKGEDEPIVMIHAAITGSLERFAAVLIEHLAGNFPAWLAPVQIKILTVSEKHIDFVKKLAEEFKQHDLRVLVDDSNETLGNKIRKNSAEKIPYTLVIGDKEMTSKDLMVRVRGQQELVTIKKEKFIKQIQEDVAKRSLDLIK
jgi:threonyl-tRNA synthetase